MSYGYHHNGGGSKVKSPALGILVISFVALVGKTISTAPPPPLPEETVLVRVISPPDSESPKPGGSRR